MVLIEFLSVFQIALQLISSFLAFKIGKLIGVSKYWYSLVLAFLLMAFRRTTALLITLGIIPQFDGLLGLIDGIYLPLLISIFLLIGVYSLYKRLTKQDG